MWVSKLWVWVWLYFVKRLKEKKYIFGICKSLKCMLNCAPEKILFSEGLLLNKGLKAGMEGIDKYTKLQGMKLCLFWSAKCNSSSLCQCYICWNKNKSNFILTHVQQTSTVTTSTRDCICSHKHTPITWKTVMSNQFYLIVKHNIIF